MKFGVSVSTFSTKFGPIMFPGNLDRDIKTIADLVHQAGGLMYFDGANLNAILGKTRPSDMGFDVIHFNLHKTFSTPHGGGGPGSGPISTTKRLAPFLPTPLVEKHGDVYRWTQACDRPQSIGRLSTFTGNTGVLIRAYVYMRMLGKTGMTDVANIATLNANYLQIQLQKAGFMLAYPNRLATHEFIITLKDQTKQYGIKALDYAKRLLDYRIPPPTTYFPLLIPECLLIEPTETESKATLDAFVDTMVTIMAEVKNDPDRLKGAPWTMPVKRLDDVKAAREIDITETESF